MAKGIVTGVNGPSFTVEVDQREVACVLRGRLKREWRRTTNVVVVGDVVEVTRLDDGTGVIEHVAPRRTELARPGFRGETQVMAANVDRLVAVQAARQPAFQRRLVERFLALGRQAGIDVLVVVNKCDLVDEALVRSWIAPLIESGVDVLRTSAVTGEGLDELRARLSGKVSVLAGKSGVGKSSIVNALLPGMAAARTRAVSGASARNPGQHTTTASRLYKLPVGGYLVDTPGVRELGLFEGAEDAVGDVFPEIERYAAGCRFRDCTHTHEPRCAVKEAVARGEIDEDRYRHYVKLRSRR
ncbi:MAG: ribosome small subunit-dependent GTPase A [Firmicutes bacterium]|nr:ribosome small subunit-dependent GTPase A [Bacillota bacterium]